MEAHIGKTKSHGDSPGNAAIASWHRNKHINASY